MGADSVGSISYGLEIIEGFLMGGFRHQLPALERSRVALLMPVVAFGVTFALATVSYRCYELPFLRLKTVRPPSWPVSITGRDPMAPARRTAAPEPGELLPEKRTVSRP